MRTLLTRLVKLPTQAQKPTAESRVASLSMPFSVYYGAATHERGEDMTLKLYAPSNLLALPPPVGRQQQQQHPAAACGGGWLWARGC